MRWISHSSICFANRGLVLERFGRGMSHTTKLMTLPYFFILKYAIGPIMKMRAKVQGIGKHTEQEVVELMKKDLSYVSNILGDKKFICGEEMCEEDCAIFGFLAQVIWGLPDSPYEKWTLGKFNAHYQCCNYYNSYKYFSSKTVV